MRRLIEIAPATLDDEPHVGAVVARELREHGRLELSLGDHHGGFVAGVTRTILEPGDPDPARLTDEQIDNAERFAVARLGTGNNTGAEANMAYSLRAVLAALRAERARLAAAENAAEAAKDYLRGRPGDQSREALQNALAAYDAHKREPTGNRAESSLDVAQGFIAQLGKETTRGDTNE